MTRPEEVAAVARQVLEESDLNEISEKKLRQIVKEKTGADTSLPDLKALIHSVVHEFISKDKEDDEVKEEAAEEEADQAGRSQDGTAAKGASMDGVKGMKRKSVEDEEANGEAEEDDRRPMKKGGSKVAGGGAKQGAKKFAVGESGELIVCKLSGKRKVTVGEFRGTLFVSIREFYEKDGQERPGKGISLPLDQWEIFTQHLDDVNLAIKQVKH